MIQFSSNVISLIFKSGFGSVNVSGFNLLENKVKKNNQNDLIYTGCQIINKDLFKSYSVRDFSISDIWKDLVSKKNYTATKV